MDGGLTAINVPPLGGLQNQSNNVKTERTSCSVLVKFAPLTNELGAVVKHSWTSSPAEHDVLASAERNQLHRRVSEIISRRDLIDSWKQRSNRLYATTHTGVISSVGRTVAQASSWTKSGSIARHCHVS